MKRLFVGGPWHGEVHEIPDDTTAWQVAETKDLADILAGASYQDEVAYGPSYKRNVYSINKLIVFDRFIEYMAVDGSKDIDMFFDAIVRPELKEFFHKAPEQFRTYTKQRNSGSGRFRLD